MPSPSRQSNKAAAAVAVIDSRLTALERTVEGTEARHREDMSRIEAKLGTIQVSIEELKLRIASQPQCPAPGSCLSVSKQNESLTKTVEALATKVAELDAIKDRGQGAWKTVLLIGGFVGFVISTVISLLRK